MKPRFLAVVVIGLFVALIWLLAGCDDAPETVQYPPLPTMPAAPDVRPAKPKQAVIRVPSPTPAHGWIEVQADRWKRARVRPEKEHFAQAIAAQITRNRVRYQAVSNETGVPWQVIGCLHNMEASLNFRTNLGQGDPLTARSRHVPKGRPPNGNPPFTWTAAAIDALQFDRMDRKYWGERGQLLQNVEGYNGLGYQRLHPTVPSPYLWSWSTIETPGKFIADGQWSSTARSSQCRVGPILRALEAP